MTGDRPAIIFRSRPEDGVRKGDCDPLRDGDNAGWDALFLFLNWFISRWCISQLLSPLSIGIKTESEALLRATHSSVYGWRSVSLEVPSEQRIIYVY